MYLIITTLKYNRTLILPLPADLVFSILSSRNDQIVCRAPVGGENEPIVSLPLRGLGARLERLNDQGLPTAVEHMVHVGRPARRIDRCTYVRTYVQTTGKIMR